MSPLGAEHKFNCDITGLRKAEKMSITILVLLTRARQQPTKLLGSCQAIFTDVLGMKHMATKIFLKLLNFKQKLRHMDIAQEMSTTLNDDPDFLRKFIASNESWVYPYDIKIKAQLSQWKRPEEPNVKF